MESEILILNSFNADYLIDFVKLWRRCTCLWHNNTRIRSSSYQRVAAYRLLLQKLQEHSPTASLMDVKEIIRSLLHQYSSQRDCTKARDDEEGVQNPNNQICNYVKVMRELNFLRETLSESPPTETGDYTCNFCNAEHHNWDQVWNHMIKIHLSAKKTGTQPTVPETSTAETSEPLPSTFARNMTSSKDATFKDSAKKSTAEPTALVESLVWSAIQQQTDDFVCHLCKMKHPTREQLWNHMMASHLPAEKTNTPSIIPATLTAETPVPFPSTSARNTATKFVDAGRKPTEEPTASVQPLEQATRQATSVNCHTRKEHTRAGRQKKYPRIPGKVTKRKKQNSPLTNAVPEGVRTSASTTSSSAAKVTNPVPSTNQEVAVSSLLVIANSAKDFGFTTSKPRTLTRKKSKTSRTTAADCADEATEASGSPLEKLSRVVVIEATPNVECTEMREAICPITNINGTVVSLDVSTHNVGSPEMGTGVGAEQYSTADDPQPTTSHFALRASDLKLQTAQQTICVDDLNTQFQHGRLVDLKNDHQRLNSKSYLSEPPGKLQRQSSHADVKTAEQKKSSSSITGRAACKVQYRQLRCLHCRATFASTLQLRRHALKVHQERHPFKCETCGAFFKFMSSSVKHRREHH